MRNYDDNKFRIFLTCSNGGHLVQLYKLEKFWSGFDRIWVTFDGEDSKYLLSNENKIIAFSPSFFTL